MKHNLKYEFWRWRIFAVTWIAYAGFYLTRKAFAVAKIGLAEDPNILMTKTQMGAIDEAYLIAYAVGQFIWGVFGDRFGTRKIILAGMMVSVIAGFAMGLSSCVLLFGILFCIQGLCQSTGWAPLTKNISYWFSQKERGVVMGWWCTNYAVGGFIASPFAGYLAYYFTGWRYAFFGTAVTLAGIWLLFLLFQRNRPEDVGLMPVEQYHAQEKPLPDTETPAPPKNNEAFRHILFSVLKNRIVLLLGAVYFFLKPTRYAILFWAPLYVNEKFGTGMAESGLISASFELAGPAGALFGGYVSDKIFQSRRMPISIICLIALAAVLFAFNTLAAMNSKWIIAGLFFMIGFLLYVPDSLLSGTAAIDFGEQEGASTAAGFINGCGSIGAILGGSLPGWISEQWGWNSLFVILAVCVTIASLLLLPKWNAVPKPTKAESDVSRDSCSG